ncbi:LEAF RUST 10 DISEASE-RESISTANCE LOCUS RECEPTOR-LIKE PROTEIN KINASE-like 2.1 [Gossypium arboreum]|nr:LEAF RUST 10 DISEASE-RESISTANCE LOCUS RECEPTOR-LIKE PROTEIN KINASE-like 2.1 [Gossypium arboreum]
MPSKFWFIIITISLVLILSPKAVFSNNYLSCSVRSSCGNISDIGYPFWGLNRPERCGYPGFKLSCSESELEITINSATYRVLAINKASQTVRVSRTDYSENLCPTHLINSTFGSETSPFQQNGDSQDIRLYYGCQPLTAPQNLTSITGISNRFDCTINNTNIVGYYVTREFAGTVIGTFLRSCSNSVIIPVPNSQVPSLEEGRDADDLEEAAKIGFQLWWSADDALCNNCVNKGGQCGRNLVSGEFECYCSDGDVCSPEKKKTMGKGLILRLGLVVAITILICFLVLWFKGKSLLNQGKKKEDTRIEAFIKKFGSLAPRRYSYAEIKKMTNKFNHKLGQGGFGSVYKGKLPDCRLVAVKVLSESKENGEDFMNEVASISRTSHVNIVSLLGFCFEKSKRALIYEFMPHGSLDGFIYDRGLHHRSCRLEWRTLYDIALGIARGLEYLHQGCKTRILHFDIKPHNILLDENFCPKISDFGLSKLCERKESIISMACARGTVGYIAPEVFCRNFGGVSYKSDVYSYGMMVLEMVGGRKNIDVGASQTSEVYFPSWIYKHLDQSMNLNLNGVIAEEEEEITRKLIIVSLWCIQSDPFDRPSMTKVIEMLQANVQSLIIPPRPFVSSPIRSPKTLEHQK